MKCAKCVEAGLQSKVYAPNGGFTTCMAYQNYYDEAGEYHNHDPNSHGSTWSCSNGHKWHVTTYTKCGAKDCGWNATHVDKIAWEPTPSP